MRDIIGIRVKVTRRGGGEYPTYVGVKGGYLGGLECMGMHRCGNNLGGTTYCSMNVDI